MSVSEAVKYLAECPEEYAQAIHEEARLEQLAKNFKAVLMDDCDEKSMTAKEAWAMRQPEYRDITEKQLPDARRRVAYHKAKGKWADMVIEVWRTQNANKRAAERVR
ncbi:hypothetical protein FF098_014635 [Parvularcula flava]|uniref:Uncharacterized protein n=1 Tax=Aquisalinus luteolus TaxID=1566827 RepID=A0A8J3A3E7_9PROT|nr:hypothetical protein [Aquisalinus luteolus]NHK29154.1 hypothetical protein [Aquisalinus luteolus]GGI00140.1 hypothetical protein GCM10011355_27730 [Aquisalinus luteolus]